jgi:hypothetical protein
VYNRESERDYGDRVERDRLERDPLEREKWPPRR